MSRAEETVRGVAPNIDALRALADEADADVEERKADTDMSDPDPAQMAVAEVQGMRKAYEHAWKVAIAKRNEVPEGDDG